MRIRERPRGRVTRQDCSAVIHNLADLAISAPYRRPSAVRSNRGYRLKDRLSLASRSARPDEILQARQRNRPTPTLASVVMTIGGLREAEVNYFQTRRAEVKGKTLLARTHRFIITGRRNRAQH